MLAGQSRVAGGDMFETIGKITLGCFGLYLLMGFLSVFAIGVGVSGGPLLWVLLFCGGVVAFVNRDRIRRWIAPDRAATTGSSMLPALEHLPSADAARVQAALDGIAARAENLAAWFVDNPLEHAAFLEVSYLCLHEPPERMQQLTDEYGSFRGRFVAWRAAVAGVQQRARRSVLNPAVVTALDGERGILEQELAALETYRSRLATRAAAAPGLAAEARRLAEEATAALAEARSDYGRLPIEQRSPALQQQLDQIAGRLGQVTAIIAGATPRPLTAHESATAVCREAVELRERVTGLVARPAELGRRGEALTVEEARVRQVVSHANQLLSDAAGRYAPVCLLDVRDSGAAASNAVQRAAAHQRAARETDPRSHEPVAAALDRAFAALAEADAHARAIEAHLLRLDDAARGARRAIERAEAVIDLSFAELQRSAISDAALERRQEVVERARALTRQARQEVAQALPDWLLIVTLAQRATALSSAILRPDVVEEPQPAADLRARIDVARSQAKAARDHALALSWSLESNAIGDQARRQIAEVERSYQRAVEEATLLPATGDLPPVAADAALDAFAGAEKLARTAAERINGW